MTRASSVYIVFTAAFGVGIWAILSAGSNFLTAPENLGGKWKLQPLAAVTRPAGKLPDSIGNAMTIEQSGRYFRIVFESGRKFDLTLDQSRTDDRLPKMIHLNLTGSPWAAVIDGPSGGDEFDFHFSGPSLFDFHASRIERADQPSDAPDKPPVNTPHASHD